MGRIFLLLSLGLSALLLVAEPGRASEEITVTTYYPSPNGSYADLTVSERMAIGDMNGDDVVNTSDMMVYGWTGGGSTWTTGDPVPGSLTVSNRLAVGTRVPFWNAPLHVHNTETNTSNKTCAIALSDVNGGWNSSIYWLNSSGDRLRHLIAQDSYHNNRLFMLMNYTGTGGEGGVSETFSILGGTNNAQVAINTWDAGGYNLYVNGTTFCTSGTWTASDMRLKKNIRPLGNVLERIKKIEGVTYEWKAEEFPEKNFEKGKQIGIIAQKVEKSFPELVRTDNEGYKSLVYDRFTAVLLEAIKEQQKEIEALKKEIAAVKADRI